MDAAPRSVDRAAMLALHDEPVIRARFVDTARSEALARLGIETVGDLIHHYPFRYLDLTSIVKALDARAGSEITVIGVVRDIKLKRPRPRLTVLEVALNDTTGTIVGVWFNQPYMQQRFAVGQRVAFAGRVELDYGLKQMKAPFVEVLGDAEDPHHASRVLPVHRTTEGLSTNWLRRLVAAAIDDAADVPDHMPAAIRTERGLLPLRAALRDIHFPPDMAAADAARRRLAYDEVFQLQLYMAMRRHSLTREHAGIPHRTDGSAVEALRAALPYALTGDQAAAVDDILGDMAAPRPMNRMLLGDVGTGKTAVAAHALAVAADTGMQAAMMAPTEVLATQYADKTGPLLDAAGVRWALLTGSTPAARRREILSRVRDGEIDALFGTHALLEQSVDFARLSLAIVDEQHRFGVGQRLGLRSKGAAADLLVMTATPIPRSLALTLYGDLDVTYIRERPNAPGPGHISTELIGANRRGHAYEAVRDAVRSGHQAYVICPLVDESDQAEARAATKEAERLQRQVFSDLRVGLLTGRMRAADKADVMRRFHDRELDVLVATTVVEVGVDVPNATVMLVEDAERFGLAQLHQLRGRVGRGPDPARFIMLAHARSTESRERLEAVVASQDGFELAEQDLRLRGEGRILGEEQHGVPALRLASLLNDVELIAQARDDARSLVERDPHLSAPEHGPLLELVRRTFAEVWEWVSAG